MKRFVLVTAALLFTISCGSKHKGTYDVATAAEAGEAGFDSSETFARFRVACVDALYRWRGDYKMPPSGRLSLVEEDFVPVAEFDPDLHCVAP